MGFYDLARSVRRFKEMSLEAIKILESALSDQNTGGCTVTRVSDYEVHVVCEDAITIYARCVFSFGTTVFEAGFLSLDDKGLVKHNKIVEDELEYLQHSWRVKMVKSDICLNDFFDSPMFEKMIRQTLDDSTVVYCVEKEEFQLQSIDSTKA